MAVEIDKMFYNQHRELNDESPEYVIQLVYYQAIWPETITIRQRVSLNHHILATWCDNISRYVDMSK